MKRLVVGILAAAAAYSAFWVWSARDVRGQVDRTVAEMRAAGIEVEYDRMKLRGFPSRLDLTLEGVSVTSPDGLRIEAALVQGLQTVWQRKQWILVFPSRIDVTQAGGDVTIQPDRMRASLGLELVLEADAVRIESGAARVSAGPVLLAARPQDGGSYRTFLRASALTAGDTAQETDTPPELVFDGTLTFAHAFGLPDLLPLPALLDIETVTLGYARLTELADALRPTFPGVAAFLDQRQ